jgi:hypothetical protein
MAISPVARPALIAAALLLGGHAALAPLPAAVAQESAAQRVDPYVVVFTASEVPVRAGNSTIYYPIVFPKPGDMLVVDGETSGWLRVMYPSNLRVFVTADEVQESGAGRVRLTKASKLKAPNANSGIKGAFLGVQEAALPIGTELKVADAIKDDSGKVTAYAVEPPAGARGWISREAVRRATDAEAAPVLTKLAASNPTPPPAPVPAATNPIAPAPAAETPAAPPHANTPADVQPVITNQPLEPAPMPAHTPATDVPASNPVPPVIIPTNPPEATPVKPIATPPGMEIPGTVPVGDKDGGGGSVPRTAPVLRATNLDALKEYYNTVRAQPSESAELEPAIAAFETYKKGLGATARDSALAKQLDAYVEAMKMRKEVRDAQNANAALSRDTELMKTDLGKKIIEIEKQRVYTVIGRLIRSTVYDGGRAPVLYRVMSPEPGSARTLGYLLPDPKFDYANKLEQVVGIIGEIRADESLRTSLIVPSRVDVVSLAPIVVSPDIPGVVVPRGSTPAETKPTEPAKPAAEAPKLPSTPAPAVAPATPAPSNQPEKP